MVITKNFLVVRNLDLLSELASHKAVKVAISVTTLVPALQGGVMEPRTSSPERRLEAIERLAKAGIPVATFVAPVIPGLNDHEIPSILEAAVERGAQEASCVPLRLPYGVKDLFVDWLDRHVPDRKAKIVNRILAMRGSRLNDPRLVSRMKGQGTMAERRSCSSSTWRGGRWVSTGPTRRVVYCGAPTTWRRDPVALGALTVCPSTRIGDPLIDQLPSASNPASSVLSMRAIASKRCARVYPSEAPG